MEEWEWKNGSEKIKMKEWKWFAVGSPRHFKFCAGKSNFQIAEKNYMQIESKNGSGGIGMGGWA